jgi:hypothetical protein
VADTAPCQFTPDTAHPARVYSCWLGGKDHFEADRRAAGEVARHRPQAIAGARANRAFLARIVRYLTAERGIGAGCSSARGICGQPAFSACSSGSSCDSSSSSISAHSLGVIFGARATCQASHCSRVTGRAGAWASSSSLAGTVAGHHPLHTTSAGIPPLWFR